ncbi:tetratricopeptide repeat protein [Bacteroidota bacterium]
MKKILQVSLLLFLFQGLLATYDFNSNCKKAYYELFNLRYAKALEILNKELTRNPNNLYACYLENYAELVQVLTIGSKDLYQSFISHFESRIRKVKNGKNDSPYYNLFISEMYFHLSLVHGQFNSFVNAAISYYKSYKLAKKNLKEYPSFIFNKKILGIHELALSIIPEEYKGLFAFFGLSGSYEQGSDYINSFYSFGLLNHEYLYEAAMLKFFAVAQFGKDDHAAYQFLKDEKLDTSNNIILNISYVLALKQIGKTDEALAYLKEKGLTEGNMPVPELYYLYGSLKFTRLDLDANKYFEIFLDTYKGEHFRKHTHRKLAWYYFIQKNYSKSDYHRKKSIEDGQKIIEHDLQAYSEMRDTFPLNETLLKARLLFDGGYYEQSKKLLSQNAGEFKESNIKNQIEYFYRIARVMHEMNELSQAEKYYLLTIKHGEYFDFYFPAYACYRLGLIYEQKNNYPDAEFYLKKGIHIVPKEYKPSLERRSKIVLKRIRNI